MDPFYSNLPAQRPTTPLQKISAKLAKFRPSKATASHVRDILEGEVVGGLEGERDLRALERQIVGLDGRMRGEFFLADQNNLLQSSTAMRALDYQTARHRKDINSINDFWRQTEELKERYPEDPMLQDLITERRRQFLRQRRAEEVI